jgi:hypothetical protein
MGGPGSGRRPSGKFTYPGKGKHSKDRSFVSSGSSVGDKNKRVYGRVGNKLTRRFAGFKAKKK